MAKVTALRSDRSEPAPARDYLGPAEVTAVRATDVDVRLPSGAEVSATLALAFAYEPNVDDVLLVIGNAEGHYVIGVLRGTGRAVIAVPGDVEVRSVDGVLRLSGGKGVEIDAPDVSLRASKLRILAEAVTQKVTSLAQHVTELWSMRAGKSHSVVEGASFSQSKSATILTEGKVAINGKEIHLG
ncbi:Hypothetical protein A7982_09643 [Minicystis rosea]|nr:Hypothetical protein A7982_09643 [Minicystis rosea]